MARPGLVSVKSGLGAVFTTFDETRDGGKNEGHDDHAQRNSNRDLSTETKPGLVQTVVVHRMADELDSDKAQDHGQTQRQVHQAFQQASDEEVQLTQAHEGKDVSGKDEVSLTGEPIGRRNRCLLYTSDAADE